MADTCDTKTNTRKRSLDIDAPDTQAPPLKHARADSTLAAGHHHYNKTALKATRKWLRETAEVWQMHNISSLGKRACLELEEDFHAHTRKRLRLTTSTPTRTKSVLGKHGRSVTCPDEQAEDAAPAKEPRLKSARWVRDTGRHSAPCGTSEVLKMMLDCQQMWGSTMKPPTVVSVACEDEGCPAPAAGEIVRETIEIPDSPAGMDRASSSKASVQSPVSSCNDKVKVNDAAPVSPQSSLSAVPSSPETFPPEEKGLFGLSNISNACFSNAVIQTLDAALDPAQKSALDGDDALPEFDDGERNALRKMHGFDWNLCSRFGKRYHRCVQKLKSCRNAVRKSALLGRLFKAVQNGEIGGEGHVSPTLFQQAFAHCGPDSKPRYDGRTQEDAGEYMEDVLSTLRNESALTQDAFRVDTTSTTSCTGCGHVVEEQCSGYHLRVYSAQPQANLDSLLTLELDQMDYNPEKTCDNCQQKGNVHQRDLIESLPDKFFVQVHRTKLTNQVTLPFNQHIQLPQGNFSVGAVIYREGKDGYYGHYRCLASTGDGWALFDDQTVDRSPNLNKFVDKPRGNGISTVILLKKSS